MVVGASRARGCSSPPASPDFKAGLKHCEAPSPLCEEQPPGPEAFG